MFESRNVRVEDLYELRGLGDPILSSDGHTAATVVIDIDRDGDQYRYELHLFDLQGRKTTVLSTGASKPRSPRFSPDGRLLAWIQSTESDGDHVHIADTSALLAKYEFALTSDSLSEVSGRSLFSKKRLGQEAIWLQDGSGLFVSEVRSDLPAVKVYSNVYFKTDGVGLQPEVKTNFWVVPLEGDAREFHHCNHGVNAFALSPDGKEVAYTVQRSPETGSFTSDIYTVSFSAGLVRRVTESQGPIRSITYSPDGSRIAWIGHQSAERYATESIWTTDVETGESEAALITFDRPTGVISKGDISPAGGSDRPQFSSDGQSVYFLAQDGGSTHLYKVDLPQGAPQRLTEDFDRCVSHFSVATNGSVLFASSTPSTPEELYLLTDGSEARLTGFNDSFCSQVHLVSARRMTFDGADGWPIEGWLMLPPSETGGEGPYPLILNIHGGPHGAFGNAFTFKSQVWCGNGFAVLYVNPRGSQAYGTDFAASVIGDWGGNDYVDLMNAVDRVVEEGIVDPERLGVTGYSYGGYMTTWIVGHTNRFRAAAAGGCVSNLISFQGNSDIGQNWGPTEQLTNVWEGPMELWKHSPLAYVKHVTTPALLYHAEGDDRCPIGQSEEFFTALRAQGKEAVFIRYPGDSHGYALTGKPSLRVDTIGRLTTWFKDRLSVGNANSESVLAE